MQKFCDHLVCWVLQKLRSHLMYWFVAVENIGPRSCQSEQDQGHSPLSTFPSKLSYTTENVQKNLTLKDWNENVNFKRLFHV